MNSEQQEHERVVVDQEQQVLDVVTLRGASTAAS